MAESIPRGQARFAALLLVGLLLATPLSTAQPPAGGEQAPYTSFVRPHDFTRVTEDPWMGGLWIASETGGLFFKPLGEPGLVHHGVLDAHLPTGRVYDVQPTAEEVWIATDFGPAVLDKATGTWHPVYLDDGARLTASAKTVHPADGSVWLGTGEQGLFEIDPDTRTATPVPNPVNGSGFQAPILGLATDGEDLLISTAGYGLVVWDRSTDQAQRYGQSLFGHDPIYGRLHVNGPDVWVGTHGDGVIRWNRSTNQVNEYLEALLGSRTVVDIVGYGDEVWFATDNGMTRYDTSQDHWTWYNRNLGTFAFDKPTDAAVLGGKLFATTDLDARVTIFDRAEDTWKDTTWWTPRDHIGFNEVVDCDPAGDHLVFSTAGNGAHLLDPATGDWQRVGGEAYNGTIGSVRLYQTQVTDDGYWFSHAKGLSHWDRAENTWLRHRTDGRDQRALVANEVRDLHVTDTAAWGVTFSTKPAVGAGGADAWTPPQLNRYDMATGTWTSWSPQDGLPGSNVTKVQAGDRVVWVGTSDAGLHRFDPAAGTFEKVFPDREQDGVTALKLAGDTLYVATLFEGLHALDTRTLETSQLIPPGSPLISIEQDDQTLWVGTTIVGLREVDLVTGEVQEIHTGQPEDLFAHCTQRVGEILYVGSQWGVQRLHLPTRTWLPQVVADGQPATPQGTQASLTITQPGPDDTLDPDAPLQVQGTAQATQGAHVQVRLDAGPWHRANGTDPWQATLPTGDLLPGDHTVTARLLHGGQVLAQAARTLSTPATGAATPVHLAHRPTFDATAGQPLTLRATADPVPEGLEGTLHWQAPGTDRWTQIPLQATEHGKLSSTLPTVDQPGQAAYRLEVRWDSGAATLPRPFDGFGSSYPVTVHAATGTPAAMLTATPADTYQAGRNATLAITLHNVGTRAATFQITADGPASAWLTNLPRQVQVDAADSQKLTLELAVPAGTPGGPHSLELTAAPMDPPTGQAASTPVTLRVHAPDPPAQESPAPMASLVLALAGLAALARRRRGKAP